LKSLLTPRFHHSSPSTSHHSPLLHHGCAWFSNHYSPFLHLHCSLYFSFLLTVLGFEFRASPLLGRCS
jgi:hypothetical protein